MGGLQRTHLSQDKNIVRVYFDKWGNLYPDAKLYIPYKAFFDASHTGNTYRENNYTGNLKLYYLRNPSALHALGEFYGITEVNSAAEMFETTEKAIVKRTADEINKLLNSGDSKTLVVFIHGFNDSDPTGDYDQLRNEINNIGLSESKFFIYLEIFWDGLTSNQADPSKMKIWGRAQKNSSNVSIGLRELLDNIGQNFKIRLITHSLGASIATGALFNTNTKWDNRDKDYYKESINTPTPAQNNIRLGMIAPAIPGVSTFTDFNNRGDHSITPEKNNINRIVLGINTKDYALKKRAFGKDNAGVFGATSLGCDYKGEIIKTKKVLIDCGYGSQINNLLQEVRFNNSTVNFKEHGLYYYMIMSDPMKDFLKKIFE